MVCLSQKIRGVSRGGSGISFARGEEKKDGASLKGAVCISRKRRACAFVFVCVCVPVLSMSLCLFFSVSHSPVWTFGARSEAQYLSATISLKARFGMCDRHPEPMIA